MALLAPHSYADDTHPKVTTLGWDAAVDFSTRTLRASATLGLEAPAAGGFLDLDARDLTVDDVFDDQNRPVPIELGAPDPILGSRIRLTLVEGTKAVTVRYRTGPAASARRR